MFNAQRPNLDDLPTNRQLIRATLIAAASAGALLVAVILPSEYGVDPTGAGRVLGLTQMGEIKVQLAEEAAHGGRIVLKRAYDPSLPEILGDEDHLHEAFQNIVRNAAEAAAEAEGSGQVILQTAFETGFAFSKTRNAKRLQRAIRVTVEDNGKGIPPRSREQMFDMFSSTKAGGRGLGLSVVSEVIAAHEGRIKVESRPGQTRFSVFLPMRRDAVS